MHTKVFDQSKAEPSAVAVPERHPMRWMLRDAAVAANLALLVTIAAYLLVEGAADGGSRLVLLLGGIGFPILNLLALLRCEAEAAGRRGRAEFVNFG